MKPCLHTEKVKDGRGASLPWRRVPLHLEFGTWHVSDVGGHPGYSFRRGSSRSPRFLCDAPSRWLDGGPEVRTHTHRTELSSLSKYCRGTPTQLRSTPPLQREEPGGRNQQWKTKIEHCQQPPYQVVQPWLIPPCQV